ncbi:hypothetical protein IHC87_06850 [Photobacterium damselae subsp. damselae]|uniref:hypothetical protein n=1 Tax=Photobacterium damselae TaxID=38293 RepID=UPI001F2AD736|nr:hypothetical protein [Photobacterium damselae]UJZ95058.1 hypothetical protein IHC87_06850 [Photobacterium damselae subsp. damselae]UJZ99039.1 hypothetical protein IHC88_06840 [Photobacterium damselae subsp. damselae]
MTATHAMATLSKVLNKLEDMANNRSCKYIARDTDELVIDDDGNVSLNFANQDVMDAFQSHLEVLSEKIEKVDNEVHTE